MVFVLGNEQQRVYTLIIYVCYVPIYIQWTFKYILVKCVNIFGPKNDLFIVTIFLWCVQHQVDYLICFNSYVLRFSDRRPRWCLSVYHNGLYTHTLHTGGAFVKRNCPELGVDYRFISDTLPYPRCVFADKPHENTRPPHPALHIPFSQNIVVAISHKYAYTHLILCKYRIIFEMQLTVKKGHTGPRPNHQY